MTTILERSEKLISRIARLYYLKHPSLSKNGMDKNKRVLPAYRKNSSQEKPPLSRTRPYLTQQTPKAAIVHIPKGLKETVSKEMKEGCLGVGVLDQE